MIKQKFHLNHNNKSCLTNNKQKKIKKSHLIQLIKIKNHPIQLISVILLKIKYSIPIRKYIF